MKSSSAARAALSLTLLQSQSCWFQFFQSVYLLFKSSFVYDKISTDNFHDIYILILIFLRSVMKEEKMKSNADVRSSVNDSAARAAEDDFM